MQQQLTPTAVAGHVSGGVMYSKKCSKTKQFRIFIKLSENIPGT